MPGKFGILAKSMKNQIFLIKFNIQRFSFCSVYYFSRHLAEAKIKRKKIDKGKPFAILEFACKMLQKLSSKMLERCPLQCSVVLKSCQYVSSEIHGQQSTIGSLRMLISVVASNNKEVEVTRLQ